MCMIVTVMKLVEVLVLRRINGIVMMIWVTELEWYHRSWMHRWVLIS